MTTRLALPRVVGDEQADLVGTPVDPVACDVVRAPGDGLIIEDAATAEPVALVARYPGDLAVLRRSMRSYPMNTTVRSFGLRNRSNVFGFTSRHVVMQRNMCKACGGSVDAPDAHAGIAAAAVPLAGLLADHLPDIAARDAAAAEAVLPDWRMHDTQWTSGVLNETSPLPYHFDRNNLEPVWSAMVVARRGMRGGHLHLPAYDVAIECRDGDVVCFPGWRYVHGVTPIEPTQPDGYRFTAVYYCVAKMTGCLPFDEEVARGRRERSAREDDLRSADERLGPQR